MKKEGEPGDNSWEKRGKTETPSSITRRRKFKKDHSLGKERGGKRKMLSPRQKKQRKSLQKKREKGGHSFTGVQKKKLPEDKKRERKGVTKISIHPFSDRKKREDSWRRGGKNCNVSFSYLHFNSEKKR